jgi:hypothetical protein
LAQEPWLTPFVDFRAALGAFTGVACPREKVAPSAETAAWSGCI